MTNNPQIRVWDPLVRFFHWSLVSAFIIAFVTEDELLTIHSWAGYLILPLISIRFIWGFIGTRHARFTDFVYRPMTVVQFLIDSFRLRAKRYLGHNPAGGVMVVMLLAGLLATVGSGLVLYAIEENAGPLAGWVASQSEGGPESVQEQLDHDDDSDEIEERENGDGAEGAGELWEEAHDVLANLMLLLVILHVAGVLLASYVHRENLAKAMITGLKRASSA